MGMIYSLIKVEKSYCIIENDNKIKMILYFMRLQSHMR